MVILQFCRGTDREYLLSVDNGSKSYKPTYLGYPLMSFISDIEIDVLSSRANHLYWGLTDVQNSNLMDAKICQSRLRKIFSEIASDTLLNKQLFENIMDEYDFEIPVHSVSKTNNSEKEIIYDLYKCFSIPGVTAPIVEQLCMSELHYLVGNGYTIKKCANCGNLFVTRKSDEKYCIRASKEFQNMNCKQAAKYKKQLLREKSSESARTYHSVNTMLARRAKVAPLSIQKQEQETLFRFRNEADMWKSRIKADPSLEADYIAWLNSFKKRK